VLAGTLSCRFVPKLMDVCARRHRSRRRRSYELVPDGPIAAEVLNRTASCDVDEVVRPLTASWRR
jgi:hypothetical protein